MYTAIHTAKQEQRKPIRKQDTAYCPQILAHGGTTFVLNSGLECKLTIEGGYCTISNDLLDITVWGATRTEAEQAFAFSFDAMYRNYAGEHDNNLTDDALALKRLLSNFIKNVLICEAP